MPEYNLSISFDIEASKIFGHAQIRAFDRNELTIHTGELNIIHASANGSLIDMKGKEKEKIVLQDEKGKDIELAYIRSGMHRLFLVQSFLAQKDCS